MGIRTLGVNDERSKCNYLPLSTCVVMSRREDEPIDSPVMNGDDINQTIYKVYKEMLALRTRVRAQEAEIKQLKLMIKNINNKQEII